MTCGRCGSDRLFQFEADPRASKRAVNPSSFPLVCRNCGLITVNGVALEFPAAFEAQAKDLAESAAMAGEAAVVELAADPNTRVEKYFARVYRDAYLDGFLRCLAFYQHNAKEGKLKRLRELWRGVDKEVSKSPGIHLAWITMSREVFEEFDQLMMLGPVPD
jgi:hypothetical protein